jgi:AcrR family transcriptional regulator
LTSPAQHRRYDSPRRRQQAAETRERIVGAGADLLHGFPIWNWKALTHRAVAERSGVNERTVYRYFPSEQLLRSAVLGRLEEEADVHLEGLTLDTVADVTARILQYVSQFGIEPRTERDATIAASSQRQRDALVEAIGPVTAEWSPTERMVAAAMFDVLWGVVNYEKMVVDWGLASDDAIAGITWVIGLVRAAILDGDRPAR